MGWLRHTHLIALLLLSVQTTVLVRAVAPPAPVCACSHGEGVDCDCPVHAAGVPVDRAAFTEAEWAKLPPCHRAMFKARAPRTVRPGASVLRPLCHVPDEGLFLLAAAPPPRLPSLPRPPSARVLARIPAVASASASRPTTKLLRPPIA